MYEYDFQQKFNLHEYLSIKYLNDLQINFDFVEFDPNLQQSFYRTFASIMLNLTPFFQAAYKFLMRSQL